METFNSELTAGTFVMTIGVERLLEAYEEFGNWLLSCIERFKNLDWGDLVKEDKELNSDALKTGEGQIMGAYENAPNHPEWKLWIITESDRSKTTVLLPSEY